MHFSSFSSVKLNKQQWGFSYSIYNFCVIAMLHLPDPFTIQYSVGVASGLNIPLLKYRLIYVRNLQEKEIWSISVKQILKIIFSNILMQNLNYLIYYQRFFSKYFVYFKITFLPLMPVVCFWIRMTFLFQIFERTLWIKKLFNYSFPDCLHLQTL